MADHYDILGVSDNSSENEIKKAYRGLSLKYHPDRNKTEEAKVKMNEINAAYEVLGDKDSKNRYDHERKFGGGSGMPMQGAEEFQDINNIFSMMFGGQHPFAGMHGAGNPNIRVFHNGRPGNFQFNTQFQQMRRPDVINKQIIITLEQCYVGCVIELDIERTIENGNEIKRETENMYINIPSGINDKEVVTIHDKGNILNSMVGNINITVNIENKTQYIRQGLDIILKTSITLKDALCGFSTEFIYLNGKKFSLNNKDNFNLIKPGYKKVIPNMGITREKAVGNLIIHFDVEFPNTLDKSVRQKLAEFL